MRHLIRIAIVSLFAGVFWTGISAAGCASEIPDTLQRSKDPGGTPGWISEKALKEAMDAKGEQQGSRLESVSHLFEDVNRLSRAFKRYSQSNTFKISANGVLTTCDPLVGSYYWGKRAKDLSELVEMSTAISSVRIVESKPGFRLAQAGMLLRVEVLELLRDEGSISLPRDSFFLYDRYARMVIDGQALCLGERQVPQGEYVLFQIYTDTGHDLALPDFYMDGSVLIAPDGSFYGALLDSTVDSGELSRQLPSLDQRLTENGQP